MRQRIARGSPPFVPTLAPAPSSLPAQLDARIFNMSRPPRPGAPLAMLHALVLDLWSDDRDDRRRVSFEKNDRHRDRDSK